MKLGKRVLAFCLCMILLSNTMVMPTMAEELSNVSGEVTNTENQNTEDQNKGTDISETEENNDPEKNENKEEGADSSNTDENLDNKDDSENKGQSEDIDENESGEKTEDTKESDAGQEEQEQGEETLDDEKTEDPSKASEIEESRKNDEIVRDAEGGDYVYKKYYYDKKDSYDRKSSGWYDVDDAMDLTDARLMYLDQEGTLTFEGCFWHYGLNAATDVESHYGINRYIKDERVKKVHFKIYGFQRMYAALENCTNVEEVDFSGTTVRWEGSTNFKNYFDKTFSGCTNLKKVDFSGLSFEGNNVGAQYSLREMFSGCSSLEEVDLTNLQIEYATDMSSMFQGCEKLKTVTISKNMSRCQDFNWMFSGCKSLCTIDLDGITTKDNKMDAGWMFDGCESLTDVKISSATDEKITLSSPWYMFKDCKSLQRLDLSGMIVTCNGSLDMFSGCEELKEIVTPYVYESCKIYLNCGGTPIWVAKDIGSILENYRGSSYRGCVITNCTEGVTITAYSPTLEPEEVTVPYGEYGCVYIFLEPLIDRFVAYKSDANGYRIEKVGENGIIKLITPINESDADQNKKLNQSIELYLLEGDSYSSGVYVETLPDYAAYIADQKVNIIYEPLKFVNEITLANSISVYSDFENEKQKLVDCSLPQGLVDMFSDNKAVSGKSGVNFDFELKGNIVNYMVLREEYCGGKRDLIIEVGLTGGSDGKIKSDYLKGKIEVLGGTKVSASYFEGEIGTGVNKGTGYIFTIKDFDESSTEDLEILGDILHLYTVQNITTSSISKEMLKMVAVDEKLTGVNERLTTNFNIKLGLGNAEFEIPAVMEKSFTAAGGNQNIYWIMDAGYNYDTETFKSRYTFRYNCDVGLMKTDDEPFQYMDDQLTMDYSLERKFDKDLNCLGFDLQSYIYQNGSSKSNDFLVYSPDEAGMDYLRREVADCNSEPKDDEKKAIYRAIKVSMNPVFTVNNAQNIIELMKDSKVSTDVKYYHEWNASYYKGDIKSDSLLDIISKLSDKELGYLDAEITQIGTVKRYIGTKHVKPYKDGENRISSYMESIYLADAMSAVDSKALDYGDLIGRAIAASDKKGIGCYLEEMRDDYSRSKILRIINQAVDKVPYYAKIFMANGAYNRYLSYSKEIPVDNKIEILSNSPDQNNEAVNKGIAVAVGNSYIIQFENENGEMVQEIPQDYFELTLKYDDEALSAAGVTMDDVDNLSIYRYSLENNAYINMGGKVNKDSNEVELIITQPGEYVLGIDTLLPTVSSLNVYDTDFPEIRATFTGINHKFTAFQMTLDGEEVVNLDNVDDYYDYGSNKLTYIVKKSLAEGEHTISIMVTDENGNRMEEPYVYTWNHNVQSSPQAMYSSLSLNGRIGVNTYIKLPERLVEDTGAYVLVNDEKYYLSDMETTEVEGQQLYQFTGYVSAKEMNQNVAFKVYDGGGKECIFLNSEGEQLPDNCYVFSVNKYIEAIENGDYGDEIKKLASAIKNYGQYAQIYFHCEGDEIVPSQLPDYTAEDFNSYKLKTSGNLPEGVKYYGSSLILENNTIIRHYFTGNLDGMKASIDGKEVEIHKKNDVYYVDVANIEATNIDKTYTLNLSVRKGTYYYSYYISYSALSYAQKVLGKDNDKPLTDLVKALYAYNRAAEEYFAKK